MNIIAGCAAIVGGVAVALGAFGAHGLAAHFTSESKGWWDTATFYLLTHAVAALALSLAGRIGGLNWASVALLGGAILFAGTLYAMALGAPRWFGAITPIGGAAMILGWGLAAVTLFRS
ncbi:MAG: DUF423 domain-containing protein [Pseudomonadota bacterium]